MNPDKDFTFELTYIKNAATVMKKILRLVICILLTGTIFGQTTTTTKRVAPPPKEPFASHLWYGGNVILGLSSGNYSSQFAFGVSPMVGYKLSSKFSIGPRVEVLYNYIKVGNQSVSPVDFGGGAFARMKLFNPIFAHTEFNLLHHTKVYSDLSTEPDNREQFLLGLGYNPSTGEGASYEFSVMYDFLLPKDSNEVPFVIRAGFTWNF